MTIHVVQTGNEGTTYRMSDVIDEAEFPSTMPNIQVSIQGFDSGEGAEKLGYATVALVREIGRYIDISTLDGITIAVDYDAALRDLDRGMEGLRPQERTNDDELVGVGKAVAVRRGENVKTHIVLLAGPICAIALEEDLRDPEDFRTALALIAHECAHVQEHADRERHFPGAVLEYRADGFVGLLEQQFAEAFWGEYAVCRTSALFARSEEQRYRENFATRLIDARTNARQAIRAYRTHGDVERVLQEAGNALLEPLRMASYLFGHIDGIAEEELPDRPQNSRELTRRFAQPSQSWFLRCVRYGRGAASGKAMRS